MGGRFQRLEEPLEETSNRKRVAIACQGGGSHTAFTAGVLKGCYSPGGCKNTRWLL
jgi:hypothetical protein